VLGLLLKEVPYLILMIVGALNQVPARAHLAIARALGYGPAEAWLKAVLPQIYPQIRLPIYAVIAFSLSVVDVALILGPSNPPPLAVLAVRWFGDADIQFYFPAAAAATLLLLLVAAVVALWYGLERVAIRVGRAWIARGGRSGIATAGAAVATLSFGIAFALAALAIASMALWSFAAQWRFPDALPQAWSLANWMRRASSLAEPAWLTLVIGVSATAIALCLVLACLENESRGYRRAGTAALWILYVPLLVPQVAFLFGAQVLLVRMNFDGTLPAVVWAHLVFVLPYLFLSLADPWRAFDPRYAQTAASLGASAGRIFFRIKLPLLLRPVLIACAVAFAVSVGQYLATVFAGNGRVPTLTTEAVTLAAGADRRVIGAYAVAQALFPLIAYAGAVLLPALLFANRRDLRGQR
jgi:putative thiamine transport system permease protein